jgi:hypothetical protein
MKKSNLITIIIIVAIIVFAIFILNKPAPETPKAVAECIGKNSALYVQLGCSHCKDQENLFGDNYQYLNVTDCWFERDKCNGITATPTWIIKGETIVGVQSIQKLQELTGC